MTTLKDKVLFITGASRGIGLAIALRAARDRARIAIAAKTTEPHPRLQGTIHSAAAGDGARRGMPEKPPEPHPRLQGTIHSAAAEIRQAGGEALPIQCDIRMA